VTVLKPLKGCDEETAACLESWFTQDYPGPVQLLFGVEDERDGVCAVVRELLAAHPGREARLIVCHENLGPNPKVSKMVQLLRAARHDRIVISDADVLAPPDLLRNLTAGLEDESVGLVNCFYSLAPTRSMAMAWEAVAINADFWSQVLQARSLGPMRFALGAVMITRRRELESSGGFEALLPYLADDYQLGNRIVRQGRRIELSPVVVECWSAPQTWKAVWSHQLRWARTIRASRPVSYFFSILGNPTFWPLLWVALQPGVLPAMTAAGCLLIRTTLSTSLQRRLTRRPAGLRNILMTLVKDLLQVLIWAAAFLGNRVEWRGHRLIVDARGHLTVRERAPRVEPEHTPANPCHPPQA
jgi:ceramide glucosyltransferase